MARTKKQTHRTNGEFIGLVKSNKTHSDVTGSRSHLSRKAGLPQRFLVDFDMKRSKVDNKSLRPFGQTSQPIVSTQLNTVNSPGNDNRHFIPDKDTDGWHVHAIMMRNRETNRVTIVWKHSPLVRDYRIVLNTSIDGHPIVQELGMDSLYDENGKSSCAILMNYFVINEDLSKGSEEEVQQLYEVFHRFWELEKEKGAGGVLRAGGLPINQDLSITVIDAFPVLQDKHFQVVMRSFDYFQSRKMMNSSGEFIESHLAIVFISWIFHYWNCLKEENGPTYCPRFVGWNAFTVGQAEREVQDAQMVYRQVQNHKPFDTEYILRENLCSLSCNGRDVLVLYLLPVWRQGYIGEYNHSFVVFIGKDELERKSLWVFDPAVETTEEIPKRIRKLKQLLKISSKTKVKRAFGVQGNEDRSCVLRSLLCMSRVLDKLAWREAFFI